nr:MAG TPA: hypothetical protein [Caudoviricetes sp.]
MYYGCQGWYRFNQESLASISRRGSTFDTGLFFYALNLIVIC